MPTRVRFCPDGTYPFRQSELRQGGGESLALLFAFAFDRAASVSALTIFASSAARTSSAAIRAALKRSSSCGSFWGGSDTVMLACPLSSIWKLAARRSPMTRAWSASLQTSKDSGSGTLAIVRVNCPLRWLVECHPACSMIAGPFPTRGRRRARCHRHGGRQLPGPGLLRRLSATKRRSSLPVLHHLGPRRNALCGPEGTKPVRRGGQWPRASRGPFPTFGLFAAEGGRGLPYRAP